MLTFRYGTSASQAGELHLPAARSAARAQVVCLLHGGFWRAPYGREQLAPLALDLAGRGFAVWNIGYRKVGEPGGGWPGTLDDVRAALAALASFDPSLALDLARVTLVGHSAGGQLALWAAADARGSAIRIAGVAGLAPVSDLTSAHAAQLGRRAVEAFLGGTPAVHADRYAGASPFARLPLGVPQLILHGSEDDAVPPAMSESYVRAARAAGDEALLQLLPGTGHMEFLDPASEAHSALCRWLDR